MGVGGSGERFDVNRSTPNQSVQSDYTQNHLNNGTVNLFYGLRPGFRRFSIGEGVLSLKNILFISTILFLI